MTFYENAHDQAIAKVNTLKDREGLIQRLRAKEAALRLDKRRLMNKHDEEGRNRSIWSMIFDIDPPKESYHEAVNVGCQIMDIEAAINHLKEGEPISEETLKRYESL